MNSGQAPVRSVICPTCGGDSIFAPSNIFRPFCSERCKQIDLGNWASENFRTMASPSATEADYLDGAGDHLHQ